jgi:tetratricopeptide (TPR) repeat protein
LRIAEQLFQKAITLDSNFAAAYANLSTIQSDMYWQYFERNEENLIQSKANAERALSLDPNLPGAHVAMGNYYYHGKLDYEPALREYNEAIGLQPNNADAYSGIGAVQRRQAKIQQAVISFRKVYEFDPRSFESPFELGNTYLLLREYEQAILMIDRAISLTPDVVDAYFYKAKTYLLMGGESKKARAVIEGALKRKIGEGTPHFNYALATCNILEGNLAGALNDLSGIGKMENQFIFKPEELLVAQIYRFMKKDSLARKKYNSAIQILERKIAEHPEDSRLYSALGLTYAGLGRKADAIREGKRGIELLPISKEAWRGSYRLFDLAQIYAMVGEQESALDAIEELLEKPTDALSVALIKNDPSWDSLRDNPRFQKLIQNMN